MMENEKRLIDANELQFKPDTVGNTMNGVLFVRGRCGGKTAEIVSEVLKYMTDNARTVDAVEVVHGRWVEDTITDMIACTECGHAWNIIDNCTETFNYCPNCGAKMDGERKDNA